MSKEDKMKYKIDDAVIDLDGNFWNCVEANEDSAVFYYDIFTNDNPPKELPNSDELEMTKTVSNKEDSIDEFDEAWEKKGLEFLEQASNEQSVIAQSMIDTLTHLSELTNQLSRMRQRGNDYSDIFGLIIHLTLAVLFIVSIMAIFNSITAC